MQTILQSIQDFWQGNTQLKALGTLYLSQAPEGLALPIYTMDVISFTPQYESPTEYVYNRMTVQINCWATTDSTIFTSLDLIDSQFNLQQLVLSTGGQMILMKKIGGKILKEDRDVWHGLSEYLILA